MNKWIYHVKSYAQKHKIPYKKALKEALPSYMNIKSGGMLNNDGTIEKKGVNVPKRRNTFFTEEQTKQINDDKVNREILEFIVASQLSILDLKRISGLFGGLNAELDELIKENIKLQSTISRDNLRFSLTEQSLFTRNANRIKEIVRSLMNK